jgi:hypothetical protein
LRSSAALNDEKILFLSCRAGEFRHISAPSYAILPPPRKSKLLSVICKKVRLEDLLDQPSPRTAGFVEVILKQLIKSGAFGMPQTILRLRFRYNAAACRIENFRISAFIP